MTALATTARRRSGRARTHSSAVAETLFAAAPERSTLESAVSGAWEDLFGVAATACLVCGGVLLPRFGAGPHPVGGRCADCGSSLD